MDNDPILLKYETIIRKSYYDSDVIFDEKKLEEEGKEDLKKYPLDLEIKQKQ